MYSEQSRPKSKVVKIYDEDKSPKTGKEKKTKKGSTMSASPKSSKLKKKKNGSESATPMGEIQ